MQTRILTTDSEAVKLYSELVYRDVLVQSMFSGLFGDENSPIQMREDLKAERGDSIQFALLKKLVGDPIVEGETLSGREEKLDSATMSVVLGVLRNGIAFDKMSKQRAQYDLPSEVKVALKNWLVERVDYDLYKAISDSHTNVAYAGSATSDATLTSTDKVTPALIKKLVAVAETGNNGEFIPVRPILVDGEPFYVLYIHPEAAYDLKVNTDWLDLQKTNVRGSMNPIFNGSIGSVSNCVVRPSRRIERFTNGGSGGNVTFQKGLLLGAQAGCVATAGAPAIIMEERDYNFTTGYAIEQLIGFKRSEFDSLAYGSIAVHTAMSSLTI